MTWLDPFYVLYLTVTVRLFVNNLSVITYNYNGCNQLRPNDAKSNVWSQTRKMYFWAGCT